MCSHAILMQKRANRHFIAVEAIYESHQAQPTQKCCNHIRFTFFVVVVTTIDKYSSGIFFRCTHYLCKLIYYIKRKLFVWLFHKHIKICYSFCHYLQFCGKAQRSVLNTPNGSTFSKVHISQWCVQCSLINEICDDSHQNAMDSTVAQNYFITSLFFFLHFPLLCEFLIILYDKIVWLEVVTVMAHYNFDLLILALIDELVKMSRAVNIYGNIWTLWI